MVRVERPRQRAWNACRSRCTTNRKQLFPSALHEWETGQRATIIVFTRDATSFNYAFKYVNKVCGTCGAWQSPRDPRNLPAIENLFQTIFIPDTVYPRHMIYRRATHTQMRKYVRNSQLHYNSKSKTPVDYAAMPVCLRNERRCTRS